MERLLLFPFLLLILQPSFAQDHSQNIKELDAYIEASRQDWKIPGIAVAVVKNGEVLLAKGYGERELGSGKAVDSKTIYNIGSTTKAITAVAMAILVEDFKVKWEDKVIEHMPEFQLYDPYTTRDMRIRDLFSHNLGLPNADYLWANTNMRPAEILYRMRYLEPAYPLRAGYTYQNIMYLAAGELIAKVSGQSWADFITENIFKPLGMNNTYATKARSQVEENRSIAHHYTFRSSEIIPIQDFNADSIAAAGAIWSNIEDMAKWMQCMLNKGRYGDKRLIEEYNWAELFKPHALIPKNQFYPTTRLTQPKWTSYGLGWFQHDYQGRAIDFHTGSLPGTMAMIGLMHSEGIGYYFFGNLDHAELRHALMYKVFDTFLGEDADGRDWSQAMIELYDPISRKNLIPKAWGEEVVNPTYEAAKYTGSFGSEVWGKVRATLKEGELYFQYDDRPFEKMQSLGGHTFFILSEEAWRGPQRMQYQVDVFGEIISLKIGPYEFTKGKITRFEK
ncbi:MAG: serine hydrolase domain-containing protein [Bacteroidota bacterium]